MPLTYEPLSETYVEPLAAHTSYCFNVPVEGIPQWWRQAGHENVRLVREGERVLGGAVLIWMGQYFAGRRVPICGVAAVAVPPEARGRGVARHLMREIQREARTRQHPLTTLYASTFSLYRSVGYELAGGRYEARVKPTLFPHAKAECTTRRTSAADHEAIEALRRLRIERVHGALDLADTMWQRIREPRTGRTEGYCFEAPDASGPSAIEGYAYVHFAEPAPWFERVQLLDWGAKTSRAFHSLTSFLGAHSTLWKELVWNSEPRDPLIMALPDRWYTQTTAEHWLLRITDLQRAVAARGYAPGTNAVLELDVQDELLAENAGRWRLVIADGRARLERGGEGALRLGIGALAALFAGHSTAEDLVLTGALDAAPEAAARATDAFASPPPAMLQRF